MAEEFISLLATDSDIGGDQSLIYNQTTLDDPTTIDVPEQSDFAETDFTRVNDVIQQTNSHDELCDIWVAKCPLVRLYVNNCCSHV